MFKDFDGLTPLTASDVDNYLMKQVVIVCTSIDRPSSPVEGMTIYETDTDIYQGWTGTAWGFLAVANPIKARGYIAVGTSLSASNGTEQATFRWPAIQLHANRLYRIEMSGLHLNASVTNIEYELRWRVTENNTIPTTSSTTIAQDRNRIAPSGADGPVLNWTAHYISPGTAPVWSGLLTTKRYNGTSGTVTPVPATGGTHFVLYDCGPAPVATGITF
ncbi:hypothetical protein ACIA8K_07080 [Catenuloplanes sp. NPDC051500]|uniref:hypothetical protein n=1 Tax=Catenuloplanes sp. NPDC051500 TaxID=3363959 RepID=UPI00379BE647